MKAASQHKICHSETNYVPSIGNQIYLHFKALTIRWAPLDTNSPDVLCIVTWWGIRIKEV